VEQHRATIGFLHTAPVHVERFEQLAEARAGSVDGGLDTVSVVDEVALVEARQLGPDGDVVRGHILVALDELERRGADVIVCTCSTISGTAELVGRGRSVPVVRIDRPMADAAVDRGTHIAVVAALQSTLDPTRHLLEEVAAERGRPLSLSLHLVDDAWSCFEGGDDEGYLRAIAAACTALDGTCDVIVLAQASMAGAVDRLDLSVPVLCSPGSAVDAALRLL